MFNIKIFLLIILISLIFLLSIILLFKINTNYIINLNENYTNVNENNNVKDYNWRLNFYLGTDKDTPHLKMNEYTIDDLTYKINPFDDIYDLPLKNLLIKTNNIKKKFSYTRGDVINKNQQHQWSLSKNRADGNTSSIILKTFGYNRHWGYYYNKPRDIIFEKKKNIIFWRGTTTSASQQYSSTKWEPKKVNRFIMIEKWFNKKKEIDIGFSFIHRDWLKKKYSKYVKGNCKIEKFLEHKYIISIEGNDKDSGINWKLNSNSLVLMPRPRVTSWLMETTLIPNYHYLLLKDDFSDMYEKYIWCENNQDKCKEIIKNANIYMKQFENKYIEEKLEVDVLNKYFELKDKLKY